MVAPRGSGDDESYRVPYRSGPAHLDLAQEIGVTQTKEITTMQKLLRSL
jgi:hypothetical protein